MGNGSALANYFPWQLAAWSALLLNIGAWLVKYFKVRNERLRDQNTEESGDWARLRAEIERLDARCDHLQREVDECRHREGEWMQRAITAEAYNIGEGRALNEAQRIVSEEREADAKQRRGKDNGDGA